MAQHQLESVVVQDFPPEAAGELVGWVNLKKEQQGGKVIANLYVAYSEIAMGGAKLAYDKHKDGYMGANAWYGFRDNVELGVTAVNRAGVATDAARAPGYPGIRQEVSEGLMGWKLGTGANIFTEGTWVRGRDNILPGIKELLTSEDALWLYAAVYYNLAFMAKDEHMLPDPDMHSGTLREIKTAQEYKTVLRDAKLEDDTMAKNLTVFGSVKPEDVPGAFRASRLSITDLEYELTELRDQMALGDWYLRVGYGRPTPFMDPTQPNERRAFGKELRGLENKNIEPARRELAREIAELQLRLQDAWHIRKKLGRLSTLELMAGQKQG